MSLKSYFFVLANRYANRLTGMVRTWTGTEAEEQERENGTSELHLLILYY